MDRQALIAAMQATAAAVPVAVSVDGWGTVHVRQVTVAEVEQQTADADAQKDKRRLARAAARVLCDEKGRRIFDPDNDADVDLISAQPWDLLRRVLEASQSASDPGKA
jgi:hypothetical protein